MARGTPKNEWLVQTPASDDGPTAPPAEHQRQLPSLRLVPQPGSVALPSVGQSSAGQSSVGQSSAGLPSAGQPAAPAPGTEPGGWWWLGCHGGAGVSTLAEAVPGGQEAFAWPQEPAGIEQPVVLVCRSSARGLLTAQEAARQWAAGAVPQARLLGLAVVADAPGDLPRPLKDLLRLIRGGVPASWHVPWVEAWRLGEPAARDLPRSVASMARDLESLVRRKNHA